MGAMTSMFNALRRRRRRIFLFRLVTQAQYDSLA